MSIVRVGLLLLMLILPAATIAVLLCSRLPLTRLLVPHHHTTF
jgi:hypothetical protein